MSVQAASPSDHLDYPQDSPTPYIILGSSVTEILISTELGNEKYDISIGARSPSFSFLFLFWGGIRPTALTCG